MRILMVHNLYKEPGGEDTVFTAETELLRRKGHDVTTLEVHNNTIDHFSSPVSKMQLAASTIWSRQGSKLVTNALRETNADIVHFHNTFPLLSPSAYVACQQQGVPVIQTLHNYRLMCPNVLFYRDSQTCEDCLSRLIPWPAIQHGCYHDSRTESAVIAGMLVMHRLRRTWQRDVNVYIALTEFSRQKFLAAGIPAERIVVKPNFVSMDIKPTSSNRSGFLFVGRLSPEKGIRTLLNAWDRSEPPGEIKIAGDGPLQNEVLELSTRQSAFQAIGRRCREDVLEAMKRASALVFPSECYENFPVTIAEAFASALPVIATRHGAMQELVREEHTGLLFEPGNADDLFQKIAWATNHPEQMRQMGRNAYYEYKTLYTNERNYKMLMSIYQEAINSGRAHTTSVSTPAALPTQPTTKGGS